MEHLEEDDQRPERTMRRSTRLRRLAALIFIVLVVGIWKLWYGTAPNVPDRPVRLERGDDGAFRPAEGGETPDGARFEFHAGELKANNNFNSTVVSSTSGNARFASRRVAIFNDSDHLLLELVGVRLVEHFEKLPHVQSIEYFPRGHRPEPGGVAPDVVVTLRLDRIVESGFAPVRELDANIFVTAGTRYRKCRSGYRDNLTPPIVDFGFKGELHHVSTVTGISSSAAKYKQTSENIAGEISKTLAGKFTEFRKKHGPLPELPESFYPPYTPPQGIPILDAYELEPVLSHRGFMFPSESFWRLTTTRDLAEILPEMEQLLKDAGWRTRDLQVEENRIPHLRAVRSPEALTVFVEENEVSRKVASEPDENGGGEPVEYTLLVHHLIRMGTEDVSRGISELFDTGAPLETLLTFEDLFRSEHWRRLVTRIEDGSVTTAKAWSVLAHRYHHRKDEDAARRALLSAWVLSRTDPDSSDLQGKLRQLAKKLDIHRLDDLPISQELLDGLGFTELGTGEPVPAIEVGVDEPVRFYGVDDKGELILLSLWVGRDDHGPQSITYPLHYAQAGRRMSSHGYGGTSFSTRIGNGETSITATRIDGADRFRVEVEPDR